MTGFTAGLGCTDDGDGARRPTAQPECTQDSDCPSPSLCAQGRCTQGAAGTPGGSGGSAGSGGSVAGRCGTAGCSMTDAGAGAGAGGGSGGMLSCDDDLDCLPNTVCNEGRCTQDTTNGSCSPVISKVVNLPAEPPLEFPGQPTYAAELGSQAISRVSLARRANGNTIVIANSAPASGGAALYAWELDAQLELVAGPRQLVPEGNFERSMMPTAVMGSELLLVGYVASQATCDAQWFESRLLRGVELDTLTTRTIAAGMAAVPCADWWRAMHGSAPDVARGSSGFVVGWTDHRDGTARAYVATLDATGRTLASGPVLPSLADSTVALGAVNGPNRVLVAQGSESVAVVFSTENPAAGPEAARPRVVLLAPDLSDVIAGPIDLEDTVSSFGVSLAHTGATFAIATVLEGQTDARVHRVHHMSGAVLGSELVVNPAGDADPRIAAVAGGFLVTTAMGSSLGFGWTPELPSDPLMLFERVGMAPHSSAAVLPVAGDGALLAWEDGSVHLGKLDCLP